MTQETDLTFGLAIAYLQDGKSVTRSGWYGNGQFIKLYKPDNLDHINQPFIYITTVQGARVPWTPSQTDMLSTDWQVIR